MRISFRALSLFLFMPSLALGQEPGAQNPLRGLSPQAQTALVRSILREAGVTKSQMPDMRISPEVVREEGSVRVGVFLSRGERFDHARIAVPTLVVYENAVTSLGELEIAVRHEYLHYADKKSPPVRLQKLWSDAENEVLTRFDFTDVPVGIRAAVIAERMEMVKPLVEHVYIGEELLGVAPTLADSANAFEAAKAAWSRHKSELQYFYDSPATGYDANTKRWYTIQVKRHD